MISSSWEASWGSVCVDQYAHPARFGSGNDLSGSLSHFVQHEALCTRLSPLDPVVFPLVRKAKAAGGSEKLVKALMGVKERKGEL